MKISLFICFLFSASVLFGESFGSINLAVNQSGKFDKIIVLSWQLAAAKNQNRVKGETATQDENTIFIIPKFYRVFRSDNGHPFRLIYTAAADEFRFVDSNVEYEKTYQYVVSALDENDLKLYESPVISRTIRNKAMDILLVDDDGSFSGDYDDVTSRYLQALDSLQWNYDLYEVTAGSDNGPDSAMLSNYFIIIWLTGETWNSEYWATLTDTDEHSLATCLDDGGNLLLIGQDYLWDKYIDGFTSHDFPASYLKCTSVSQDDIYGATVYADGVPGTVSDTMTLQVTTPFGTTNLYADVLTTTEGRAVFSHGNLGTSAVQFFNDTSNVIFSTLEWAGINDEDAPDNLYTLLFNSRDFFINGPPLGISDNSGVGREFILYPNFPNPFNPVTTIAYYLSENSVVVLRIYNSLGQLIKTLVQTRQTAGHHRIRWNGRNDSGAQVSSGVYFYQLSAGQFTKTNKMILVR